MALRATLGRRAEQLAAEHLKAQGYRVLESNVRFPVGEIDLVAIEGAVLCFVEVRSASSDRWGGAAASITLPKRRKIIRAAQWYLARHPQAPQEMRFDAVAITWRDNGRPDLELIRGAFDASGSC